MEFRNLYNKLFGKPQQQQQTYTAFQLLNDGSSILTNAGTSLYVNDIARSSIHVIATHTAKLKPQHIRRLNGEIIKTNSNLEYTLQNKPNRYMSTFDFLYKCITRLYLDGNAFIFVNYEMGTYEFFPINFANLELVEVGGELYCKFLFHGGQQLTVPYSEMIHIRRHFNDSDLFGSKPSLALETLQVSQQTADQGLVNSIKNAIGLRGLLKFSNTMLKPSDLKQQRADFISNFMDISNTGGIGALDSKAEFIQLSPPPKVIDIETMNYLKNRLYSFFGVNEAVIQGSYSEDQFQAFYESVIEPLAVQLSQAFTNSIFTERERGFGNEIMFSSNRLQFTSSKTKAALLKEIMPFGLISINEAREMFFNLEPVEGGDKRLQSLNFVDSNKANQYQMGGNTSEQDTQDTTDSTESTTASISP